MSRRAERVGSALLREVQQMLQGGLSDPRLEAMITVTSVTVTDDLQEAMILVSVLPESSESLVLHGLRDAAAYIRRKAGRNLEMRRAPRLNFRIDRSLKHEGATLRALAEIDAERRADRDAPAIEENPSTQGQEQSD